MQDGCGFLIHLPRPVRPVHRRGVKDHLAHEPMKLSRSRIKRLRKMEHPEYRLRLEPYRVFYDVIGPTVVVLAIVPKDETDVDNVAQRDCIRGMKMQDSYIRARVDTKLKRDTERILDRLGLSTTEAIRLFLVQVRLQEGLPFHVGLKQVTRENDDILLPARMRQSALDSVYDD
jgi:addiction module RelB/DinJ family antitoxin